MSFFEIYFQGFLVIMIMMIALWVISVLIKNASIVDPFWGMAFVLAGLWYYIQTDGFELRKIITLVLLVIWGLRLSIYLGWRNFGKGEDYRYQKFRKDYGEHRYWWISFFQVFLLQGILAWLISAPLLAAQYFTISESLNFFDYTAIAIWIIGFSFEAGGDYQMTVFKSNTANKGNVLNTGFWRYTRHPNYFGDATVWWAYGLFAVAAGSFFPLLSSLLMTLLIIKVSGVALLERSLKDTKPNYRDYIEKTSAFLPWFPKK
jgi:steroid 5-alpha reductase family enzyme